MAPVPRPPGWVDYPPSPRRPAVCPLRDGTTVLAFTRGAATSRGVVYSKDGLWGLYWMSFILKTPYRLAYVYDDLWDLWELLFDCTHDPDDGYAVETY